jgi:hypothetical protein
MNTGEEVTLRTRHSDDAVDAIRSVLVFRTHHSCPDRGKNQRQFWS